MISLITIIPQFKRGRVWCTTCGNTFKLEVDNCLQAYWPKCCGETMTIDSPEERKTMESK